MNTLKQVHNVYVITMNHLDYLINKTLQMTVYDLQLKIKNKNNNICNSLPLLFHQYYIYII